MGSAPHRTARIFFSARGVVFGQSADIATWPWIMPARQAQRWDDWPHIKRWHDAVGARPGVQRGNQVRLDLQGIGAQRLSDEEWELLYGWQQAPRRSG